MLRYLHIIAPFASVLIVLKFYYILQLEYHVVYTKTICTTYLSQHKETKVILNYSRQCLLYLNVLPSLRC